MPLSHSLTLTHTMHTVDTAILAYSCWLFSPLSPPVTPRAERRGKRSVATGRASPLPLPCPCSALATPTRARSLPCTESRSPNPRRPRNGHFRRPRQPQCSGTIPSTWTHPSPARTSQTCSRHHPWPRRASRSVECLTGVVDGDDTFKTYLLFRTLLLLFDL